MTETRYIELDLNEIAGECYRIADEHGWHESAHGAETLIPEKLLMLHSEVTEVTEAYRDFGLKHFYSELHRDNKQPKPLGVMSEIADVFIRLADLAQIVHKETRGLLDIPSLQDAIIEKMEYNKGRSYRHGGKAL